MTKDEKLETLDDVKILSYCDTIGICSAELK